MMRTKMIRVMVLTTIMVFNLANNASADEGVSAGGKSITPQDQEEARRCCILGDRYTEQEQYGKAEDAYKRAIKLDPSDHIFYSRLAACYQAAGRYVDAVRNYQEAIEFADSGGDIAVLFNSMGATYLQMMVPKQAAAAFEQSLLLVTEPNDEAMICGNIANVSIWMIASGEIEEALRLCDIALKNDPKNVVALRNKAYALALSAREECRHAHRLLDQVLKIDPNDARALVVRAHIYLEEGKTSEALEEAERAIQVSKGKDPWCQSTLGEVYVRSGQYEKAIELLTPLVEDGADFGDPYYWYGQALANSGQRRKAVKFVRKAVSKSPLVIEYTRGLAALEKR